MAKRGKPTTYNDEIAGEILTRIVEGESLRRICRDEHMPNAVTVLDWRAAHSDFDIKYAQAREAQADTYADEIVEISDDGRNDYMERFGRDGESLGYFINGEHVQRSKLRVDARRWVASKLSPRKYGDKVQAEVSGPNGGEIVISTIKRKIVRPADDNQDV